MSCLLYTSVTPPLREVASVAVFLIGIAVGEAQGMFGVAQVIEMQAVHIVTFHDFADEAHQVFFLSLIHIFETAVADVVRSTVTTDDPLAAFNQVLSCLLYTSVNTLKVNN